jgi:hypothetical protein
LWPSKSKNDGRINAKPKKVIRGRRRSGGSSRRRKLKSSRFPKGRRMRGEMNDASCVCVCVCGKRDGFSWRRVDATCEQTFPYPLLALFSKERKAKRREPRRARHPIGYPAYLAHLFSGLLSLYYWLMVVLITP